jgi:hypothetical protein
MTAAKTANSNGAGHVQLKATNIVGGILPSPKHTSFVMACLKAMDVTSFAGKDSDSARWWKINPQAQITLANLNDVLRRGEVFTSRGRPNDPYKLQVVETSRVKTAEEQLKEENAELKQKLVKSDETIQKLETEAEKLKTALREALGLAKQVCQIAQGH